MKGVYDVMHEGVSVGSVHISQQGLYLCISCVALALKGKYRLYARSRDQRVDFGLCVPDGGKLRLYARIPEKRFFRDDFLFEIVKQGSEKEMRIPIHTDRPFPALGRLEEACFEHGEEKSFAVIKV